MIAENLFGPVRQWGFLVKDLNHAMKQWHEVMGVGPWWGYRNVPLETEVNGEVYDVRMDVGLAFQNGVQIELIQQTNDVPSPYSDFFLHSDEEQVFHQIAFFAPDIEQALLRAKNAGLVEVGLCKTPLQRFYYLNAPWLGNTVVELLEVNDSFVSGYESCAEEAENWDGSNPYRLISL